jgi:chromate transporter
MPASSACSSPPSTNPSWTSAIHAPADFALALAAFGLLTLWRVPPWLVVAFAAAGGSAIAALH